MTMKRYKLAKRYRTENLQKVFACVIISLIVLFCFAGCKTIKMVEQVPIEVHDTAYIAKVQYDSIHIDHYREVTKMVNDTILVRDSVSVVKYRIKTDTAYKYIEKPVTITQTEIVEVERPLAWWQKVLIWVGAIAFFALLAWVVKCIF